MNKLMKKKKKGFTLIELIAVIAILAILAVVAVPRVITYVEKSKKVAIQTEASTIYNAAEAAYNDGKLKEIQADPSKGIGGTKEISASADKFDTLNVDSIIETLTNEKLLNNVNKDKLGNATTLGALKVIMNTKTDDLKVSSDGKLVGTFTNGQDGKLTYNSQGN